MPAQASDRLPGAVPTVAITADLQTPVAAAAGAVIALDFADELSVVQTRFATTELALLRAHLGHDLAAVAREGDEALAAPLPGAVTAIGPCRYSMAG